MSYSRLPEILHFPRLKPTDPIWMTVTLIEAEIRRTRNQSGRIVDRLTEVLFLQLLNYHVIESDGGIGFLAALHDRRVHHAIALIHKELSFDWSLRSLGEQVGMSRATLIRHFEDAVGMTPMKYIVSWRVTKAYNLIKHTSTPLDQIARLVGFASASTLSKAFQRHYKCTPNKLIRTHQQS
ncbi:MAG: helix-turn-helix domain-containing protein [Pseudomonadales bacterium]